MAWEYTAYNVSRFQSSYFLNSSCYNVLQWDIIIHFCPLLGLWIYNRSQRMSLIILNSLLVVYKLAYLSKNLTFPFRGLLSSGLGGGKEVQKVSPWDFGGENLKLKRTFYTLLSPILVNDLLLFFTLQGGWLATHSSCQ